MTKIYNQHDKAFSNVSAFVVLKDGERVATVAIKFPNDGAGRLWAYVHFIGVPVVRDYAGGYGYDKRSAAVVYAAARIEQDKPSESMAGNDWYDDARADELVKMTAFKDALSGIGGKDWSDALRDAGYVVMQAV